MPGRIDWAAPWFAPWRDPGERVSGAIERGAAFHDTLDGEGAPVRFVPASELPAGEPYERFVFERRACPTRENPHDFFNAICWIGAPRAKTRLNELQAREIARSGVGAVRGPVRDAITLFDENGAVLQAPPALWEALLAREWRQVFVELRPLWREAQLTIFGHALLEKLSQQPRKELTAHVLASPAPAGTLATMDEWLAGELSAARLAAKPFTPLPVLGVPGWCAQNENFSFYDDSVVFRARAARPSQRAAAPDSPGS
jgi:hypothetical protein